MNISPSDGRLRSQAMAREPLSEEQTDQLAVLYAQWQAARAAVEERHRKELRDLDAEHQQLSRRLRGVTLPDPSIPD